VPLSRYLEGALYKCLEKINTNSVTLHLEVVLNVDLAIQSGAVYFVLCYIYNPVLSEGDMNALRYISPFRFI